MQRTLSKKARSAKDSAVTAAHRSLAKTTAALMERTIPYIDSDDFRTVSRSELLSETNWPTPSAESRAAAPPDTPPYLASLYEFPLLTRDQEYVMFRKMHFLLYEAAKLQKHLSLSPVSSRRVRQIEERLKEADDIRNRIVQCNLRLVVSIAKTLVDSANSLEDLISDGNLPLIRSVEIFDYTRGLRFSTYATWAVRNGLYRATHRNRRQQARYRVEESEWLEQTASFDDQESPAEALIDGKNLAQLVNELDSRSQVIIRDRFGLAGQGRPAKFRELASKLRLSSERVRQLLERALNQLRELSVQHIS